MSNRVDETESKTFEKKIPNSNTLRKTFLSCHIPGDLKNYNLQIIAQLGILWTRH